MSESVSKKAKRRDDYRCQKCGYKPSSNKTTRLEAHHVIPDADDGPDRVDNLVTLCKKCHKYAPPEQLVEDYESMNAEYVGTGMRPEFDIAHFGMQFAEVVGAEKATQLMQVISELPKTVDNHLREPGAYWVLMAVFAGHGECVECVTESMSQSGRELQETLQLLGSGVERDPEQQSLGQFNRV